MITFFKDRGLENRAKVEPATGQYIGRYRTGLDVNAQTFYQAIASDLVEASSTTTVINATAHSALAGDIIKFTSGALQYDVAFVQSVTTNAITLSQTLKSTPATNDAFSILRPSVPQVDSSGSVIVSGAGGAGLATAANQTTEISWLSGIYSYVQSALSYFNAWTAADDTLTGHEGVVTLGWDTTNGQWCAQKMTENGDSSVIVNGGTITAANYYTVGSTSINSVGQTYGFSGSGSVGTAICSVSGSGYSGATFIFEISQDGTNYDQFNGGINLQTKQFVTTWTPVSGTVNLVAFNVASIANLRVKCTGLSSGSVTLRWQSTSGARVIECDSNNITSLAGTAIDTNSGNKSAGTQRTVIATDQPVLTNWSTTGAPANADRVIEVVEKLGYDIPIPQQTLSVAGTSTTTISDYECIDFVLSGTHANIGIYFEVNYSGSLWALRNCQYAWQENSSVSNIFGTNLTYRFRATCLQGIPFRVRLVSITSGSVVIDFKAYRKNPSKTIQQVSGTVNANISGVIGTYPQYVYPAGFDPITTDFSNIAGGGGGWVYVGSMATNWQEVQICNLTDQALDISFDGGSTVAYTIGTLNAGVGQGVQVTLFPLPGGGYYQQSDVYARYIYGAPTVGDLRVNGKYYQ